MPTPERETDPLQEYWLDAWQRSILYLEELRQHDISKLLSISEERRRAVLEGLRRDVEASVGPSQRARCRDMRFETPSEWQGKKEAPYA